MERITSKVLESNVGVQHGFFTRHDNLAAVVSHVSAPVLRCQQEHSADVVIVEALWEDKDRPEGDALVADQVGVAIAVITADCAPVLLVDPVAHVIGAVHAGWRGALDGVIGNSVAAMEALGAERANIFAAVGPCIGPQSYEVDSEFRHNFLQEEAVNASFFVDSVNAGHFMFDLPAYAAMQLQKAGVGAIDVLQADTCQDEARFYSHRRSQDKGRQVSVIMLT